VDCILQAIFAYRHSLYIWTGFPRLRVRYRGRIVGLCELIDSEKDTGQRDIAASRFVSSSYGRVEKSSTPRIFPCPKTRLGG